MPHVREKRPLQVLILLVLQAMSTFGALASFLVVCLDPALFAYGVEAAGAAFVTVVVLMAADWVCSLVVLLLLFFGKRAGFFLSAAGSLLGLLLAFLDFSLSGPLLPAACLLLLLSRPSRRYFRVGAAGRGEAPSPGGPPPARGSAQGAEDWDPWDRPDRR